MRSSPRPVHVWAPGIRDDTGGIQAFSRFLVRALREGFPERPLQVFVKNESLDAGDPLLEDRGLFIQTVSNKPGFLRTPALAAAGVMRGLLERPVCAITTHMHFLPALHLMRTLSGTPFASVLHGIEAWGSISMIRRHALGEADHLYAVSHFTRERIILDHGVESSRVQVMPNTFDESRFQPGEKPPYLLKRLGLRPNQPVILTVSRLSSSERYKGHDMVMRALPAIAAQFPDVRYIVAGEGSYKQALRQLAATCGVADHVLFPGFVPREELADYYRLCDVFAMPSTKEGFGIVFMEAMSCGKPVIGGNVDGTVDALAEGALGVLVPPDDVTQISSSVIQLLRREHPNRLLFDPNALNHAVSEKFGWRAFVRNVTALVKPLMR